MIKRVIAVTAISLIMSALPAHATPTFNDATRKFAWTEDLNQTTSGTIGGEQNPYGTKTKLSPTHFIDIREAIDYISSNAQCGAAINAWSEADTNSIRTQIGASRTTIQSSHINVLRAAIRDLYTLKGRAVNIPANITTSVTRGDRIFKSHIQDMRDALDGLAALTCVGVPGPCLTAGTFSGLVGWTQAPGDSWSVGPPYSRQRANAGCCSGTETCSRATTAYSIDPEQGSCVCDAQSLPICGNGGAPETGEQCDDGNTTDGDGCSSTCQLEYACSVQMTGSSIICGAPMMPNSTCGGIAAGDPCATDGTPSCQDFYAEGEFVIPGGPCVPLSGVPPSNGPWYGWSVDYACVCGSTLPIVCGNGVPQPPEQCDDGNGTAYDGCSPSCTFQPGPAPTCTDAVMNQNETGVDCGGICPACPASCLDGIMNGSETGVDCGVVCGNVCCSVQSSTYDASGPCGGEGSPAGTWYCNVDHMICDDNSTFDTIGNCDCI